MCVCTFSGTVQSWSERRFARAVHAAVFHGTRATPRSATRCAQDVEFFFLEWCRRGFIQPGIVGKWARDVHWMLLSWLAPARGRGTHRGSRLWRSAAVLSCCRFWSGVSRRATRDGRTRLLLRCCPPSVHRCCYSGDFGCQEWRDWVDAWALALGSHGEQCELAGVYAMELEHRDDGTYIGQARVHRAGARARADRHSGLVGRYYEHFLGTTRGSRQELRYQVWQKAGWHELLWAPVCFAHTSVVTQIEALCIRRVHPATQHGGHDNPPRERRRPRPYPRFRTAPSLEQELRCNHLASFQRQTAHGSIWAMLPWITFSSLVSDLGARGFSPSYINKHMWDWGREGWAVLAMADGLPFDYRRVWHRVEPRRYAARLWRFAQRLPGLSRGKVQRKVLAFLRSGGLIWRAPLHVTVRHHSKKACQLAKRVLGNAVRALSDDEHVRALLRSQIRVHHGKGPNVSDWMGHRRAARAMLLDELVVPSSMAAVARFADVVRLPQHWDCRCSDVAEVTVDDVLDQIGGATFVDDDFKRACRTLFRGSVRQMRLLDVQTDNVVARYFPVPAVGTTLVPLDRDLHTNRRLPDPPPSHSAGRPVLL